MMPRVEPPRSDRVPRSRSHKAILALVVVVAVGAAALLTFRISTPDRHGDGAGPLGGTGEPFQEGEAVDPRDGATSWTFGFELCVMDPNVVATIESVGPTQSVGTYRILGMGIRSFSPSAGHTTLIGVEGYPAKVPDVLATPSGYVVRTACSHDPSAPTTELLVGF